MQTSPQVRAREYLRVSKDKSGKQRSNEQQHGDNVTVAEAEGWALGAPYSDVGSASRYANGKSRAGFDQLRHDLRHDRFDADVLILWEASRGSRRLSVWAEFLELLEDRGVRLHVTSHGRSYDLSNARDRRSLQEDGTDSEYESAKLSGRIRRSLAANAAEGRPHGQVPFGYTRRYDPAVRYRLIAQVPDPAEAAIVRELFERLAAGHSLRGIARDFRARGIVGRERRREVDGVEVVIPGKPFSSETLRNMALNPAYIGKRRHAPGARTMTARRTSGTLIDAAWEPLIDEATWLAVERRLTDPSRRSTTRPGRGVHLLSMVARCDVCGGVLVVKYKRGRRGYQCGAGGHVRVGADDLDAFATTAILGVLTDVERARRMTPRQEHDGAAVAQAEAEVERIRKELDDLADQVGDGELSATLAARAEPKIRERLEAAIRRRDDLLVPDELAQLIPSGHDARGRWEAAPMSAKRRVVRLLLAPGKLGELRVARSGRGVVAVAERVAWRGDDTAQSVAIGA